MTTKIGNKFQAMSAIVLAAGMSFTSGAMAENFDLKDGEFAGSFITSYFSYDASNRTVSTMANGTTAKKGPGPYQSHTATDFNFMGGSCTFGDVEDGSPFYVSKSDVVLTFKKGQLYLKAGTGVAPDEPDGCAFPIRNPDTGDLEEVWIGFELNIEYRIVGGSGAYEGAKGALMSKSVGKGLEYNNNSGGDSWFGGVTGTLEGSFCTDCP